MSSNQTAHSQSAAAPGARAPGAAPGRRRAPAAGRALIDSTAVFNAFVTPDPSRGDCAVRSRGEGGGVVAGVRCSALLHRFEIDLEPPSGSGVRAANILGEAVGRVELRWMLIPDNYAARPGVEPPPTALDPSRGDCAVRSRGEGGARSASPCRR